MVSAGAWVPGAAVVDGWELVERLRSGSERRRVWRVRRAQDGRMGILKAAQDLEEAQRIEAEAGCLERMGPAASSSALPELIARGHDGPWRWLIIADLGRLDLERRWTSRPCVDELLDVAESVAGALARLHEAGFVHRDVKPENIVVDDQGSRISYWLVDLGIAAPVGADSRGRTATTPLGTAEYMDPDARPPRNQIAPRMDLYGLGRVLQRGLLGSVEARWPEGDPKRQALVCGMTTLGPRERALLRLVDDLTGPPAKRPTAMKVVVRTRVIREPGPQSRRWMALLVVGTLGVVAVEVLLPSAGPSPGFALQEVSTLNTSAGFTDPPDVSVASAAKAAGSTPDAVAVATASTTLTARPSENIALRAARKTATAAPDAGTETRASPMSTDGGKSALVGAEPEQTLGAATVSVHWDQGQQGDLLLVGPHNYTGGGEVVAGAYRAMLRGPDGVQVTASELVPIEVGKKYEVRCSMRALSCRIRALSED